MNSEDRPIALINPNIDASITARMLARARLAVAERKTIVGITAPFGASLIVNENDLAVAGEAVASLAPSLADRYSGIIVAAFGDPGARSLQAALAAPVVGIGESALREASRGGRRFCVATTTPDLVGAIDRRVLELGIENYAGVVLTRGDAVLVTSDPNRLEQELRASINQAISELGIDAVVIGGGPLADAASALAGALAVEIVEPLAAAIGRLEYLINEGHQ